jgi:hypothetical protein
MEQGKDEKIGASPELEGFLGLQVELGSSANVRQVPTEAH